MSRHQDFLACHAAGMTVPEAAAHLGVHQTGIYRWAQRQGLRFANRKRPPPPNGQMPPEMARCRPRPPQSAARHMPPPWRSCGIARSTAGRGPR